MHPPAEFHGVPAMHREIFPLVPGFFPDASLSYIVVMMHSDPGATAMANVVQIPIARTDRGLRPIGYDVADIVLVTTAAA